MENGIIYARFSSQSQNEQSIEAQIRICSEFAENKGIKIVNVYSDKAKTGTNTDRPAFQKMVSDAQTGAFKYIIVYMFDRFARNRRDSVMYKEMLKEKYGIKVISALEPISEDEGGEFYEMFLEWNAENTANDFPNVSATASIQVLPTECFAAEKCLSGIALR